MRIPLVLFRDIGVYSLSILGTSLSPLSVLFSIILAVILFSVSIYLFYYIRDEKELPLFTFLLFLFGLRMVLLIFASSWLLIFIG
jgi:formate hydrogenlyase subunit 3/multisubunit Na+/H+ antiporter MnhD subunit